MSFISSQFFSFAPCFSLSSDALVFYSYRFNSCLFLCLINCLFLCYPCILQCLQAFTLNLFSLLFCSGFSFDTFAFCPFCCGNSFSFKAFSLINFILCFLLCFFPGLFSCLFLQPLFMLTFFFSMSFSFLFS